MRNLLSAGLFRLVRSKLLYVGLMVNVLTMAYLCFQGAVDNGLFSDGKTVEGLPISVEFQTPHFFLDDFFLQYVMLNLLSTSVFCSLFLASEYNDGVLRNKLIVGRTRSQVYLANLVTNGIYGTAISFASLLTGLCAGVPLLGWFTTAQPNQILLYILFSITTTWTCAALFTLLSMIITNRGLAVAVCVVLSFCLLFFGQYLTLNLSQPEFIQGMNIVDGVYQMTEPTPNPNYISGTTRQVYQFLQEFTPGGQCFLIANMNAETPWHLPVYSGILILLTTGLGLVLFQQKDIK